MINERKHCSLVQDEGTTERVRETSSQIPSRLRLETNNSKSVGNKKKNINEPKEVERLAYPNLSLAGGFAFSSRRRPDFPSPPSFEKFVLNESLSKNEDVSSPSKVTDRKKLTFEEKINETLDGKMVIIDLMDEDQNRKPIQQCSKFTFPCPTTPSTLKKYSHTVEQLDSTPIKMKTNVLWEFEKTLQKDLNLYKKCRDKIVSNSSFGLSVVKSKMQSLPGTKTKRPMQMDQMQQILEKVPMNKTTDAITKKIYGEIFRTGQHIEYCVVKKSKQVGNFNIWSGWHSATIIHIYTHTKMQGALRIQKHGSKDSDRVTLFRSASSSFQIRSLIVDLPPTIDQFRILYKRKQKLVNIVKLQKFGRTVVQKIIHRRRSHAAKVIIRNMQNNFVRRKTAAHIITRNFSCSAFILSFRLRIFIHTQLPKQYTIMQRQLGLGAGFAIGSRVVVQSNNKHGKVISYHMVPSPSKNRGEPDLVSNTIQFDDGTRSSSHLDYQVKLELPELTQSLFTCYDPKIQNSGSHIMKMKKDLTTQKNQALRSIRRRANIVESCIFELTEIWNNRIPRDDLLSTLFEKIVAGNINNTNNNMDTSTRTVAFKILNDGNGLSLDIYEDRIEYWRKYWTQENIKECLCCSEFVTADEIGTNYVVDETGTANIPESSQDENEDEREGETKRNTKKQFKTKLRKSSNKSTSLCNHGQDMCISCLKDYFRYQMEDVTKIIPMDGLHCPKGCHHSIPDATVLELLGEKEFRPLANKMRTRRITSRPNLRFCPNDGCGMEISLVGTHIVVLYQNTWHSVVVVEIISPTEVFLRGKYRIEFQQVDKMDVTLVLTHVPETGLTAAQYVDNNTYFFYENANKSSVPEQGTKFLNDEFCIYSSADESPDIAFRIKNLQVFRSAKTLCQAQAGVFILQVPEFEEKELWIEQNNMQTSIVGNMFEEINLSRIFSISDQESQSLPSKALTKPRALELLSCFWNESERKKALASLLCLLPSLPNSFRYSAVLTYLFAKYRKDMRTKIEKRVDKYNTHVKMNKYLDYLYKTYKIDAKDIKIATTIMNVQQDTQTKNYLYHKPRHHNIELFRSLWLRRPTKKSSGLVVNGTAVIDTSQGNNGCWQCHNCICITCGSGSHGTDSCDQHHEDALIAASHDRDIMVMCPKCRVVLERISGCDHMTCPAPPRGCTTQFCFHCLSMNPHCGSKCKKPKEANILRQKWKKERTERQKLTYETARQFQSNTETKQANEEHKRELREATESKTAMEVNLFEMRLYDKQMKLEQAELGNCEVELEREKTKKVQKNNLFSMFGKKAPSPKETVSNTSNSSTSSTSFTASSSSSSFTGSALGSSPSIRKLTKKEKKEIARKEKVRLLKESTTKIDTEAFQKTMDIASLRKQWTSNTSNKSKIISKETKDEGKHPNHYPTSAAKRHNKPPDTFVSLDGTVKKKGFTFPSDNKEEEEGKGNPFETETTFLTDVEEEVKEVTFEIGESVECRDSGLWSVGTVTDITPEIKVNMVTNGSGFTWKEIRKFKYADKKDKKETFEIGDRVQCRDTTNSAWKHGTVTDITPKVKVKADSLTATFPWVYVTKSTQFDHPLSTKPPPPPPPSFVPKTSIDDLLESNSTFNLQGSWDDTLLLSENNKSQKRANCSGQMLRESYDYNERHGKAEVAGIFSKAANVTGRKIVKPKQVAVAWTPLWEQQWRDDDLDQVNMNTDSRNGMFELDSSL